MIEPRQDVMGCWGWKRQLQQTEAQLEAMRENRDARRQPVQRSSPDSASPWLPVCRACFNDLGARDGSDGGRADGATHVQDCESAVGHGSGTCQVSSSASARTAKESAVDTDSHKRVNGNRQAVHGLYWDRIEDAAFQQKHLHSRTTQIHSQTDTVSAEVASLEGEVARSKERERLWQARLAKSERERRCVHELWSFEKQRQDFVQDVVLSTVTCANNELAMRLSKAPQN
eukprot:jgi/Ulvmu1/1545/UM110_0008.1